MKLPECAWLRHRCRQILDFLVRCADHQGACRYCFTLFFNAIVCAKIVHIYSHARSITVGEFFLWGITFFLQDFLAILHARLLMQKFQNQWARVVAIALAIPLSLLVAGMASANIAFYIVTGAEIHWKHAKSFHLDAAAIRTLLSGLTAFLVVLAVIFVSTFFLAPFVYYAFGEVLRVISSSIMSIWALFPRCTLFSRWTFFSRWRESKSLAGDEAYGLIASEDYHDDEEAEAQDAAPTMPSIFLLGSADSDKPINGEKEQPKPISLVKRLAILLPLLAVVILRCARPRDSAFIFLSLTLLLSPIEGGNQGPHVVNAGSLPGDFEWLTGLTALAPPIPLDFLPSDDTLEGFTDWSPNKFERDKRHYSSTEDPLHISNLENDLLEPLRDTLQNVSIKHIVLVKLESTRADVFPVRNGSFIWDKIADSYDNDGHVPPKVERRLSNLTRTAELLTGFPSGFDLPSGEKKSPPYGGLSASNAFTTGTYTLKSVVGTLCGVTPLVADFNREYASHIYQPCMPHIFDALNQQPDITNKTGDYTSWPWESLWMQSVTNTYDNQDLLMPVMGFNNVITKETLEDEDAKYYPPKSEEVNYYGYPDTELRPYLVDAIKDAERDHKRLFISHLTGTTHHPWGIPGDKYKELIDHSWHGRNQDINKYLNSIGFVDKWLAEILDILEDTGVANDTLIVMAGDHGLSLPNDGGVTPYDNPHLGSFKVPIVFAHPHLPPIEIKAPVISDQIVPTILDLLIESSSLDSPSTAATKDMLSMYEGQSMIRPLIQEQDHEEEDEEGETQVRHKQDWQFTVMNTGGSWLSMRSAAKPAWRLVVPLIEDLEWRFTDLDDDPHEESPMMEFDLVNMAKRLEKDHKRGEEVVQWIGDAAQVAQWWMEDNWKRWEYRGKKD